LIHRASHKASCRHPSLKYHHEQAQMKAALKLTSFDNHMKTKKIIVWLRQCSKIKAVQK